MQTIKKQIKTVPIHNRKKRQIVNFHTTRTFANEANL